MTSEKCPSSTSVGFELQILRSILAGFRRESVVVFRALYTGTGPGDKNPRISSKCAHGWTDTHVIQQRPNHHHNHHQSTNTQGTPVFARACFFVCSSG